MSERAPYPADVLWTLERSGAQIVHVVLTTAKVIERAYVDGEPVAADHPLVVEATAEWEPPMRWLGSSATLAGEAALYDRALSPESVLAHWNAWRA